MAVNDQASLPGMGLSIEDVLAAGAVDYTLAVKKASDNLTIQLNNISAMLDKNYHASAGWYDDGSAYEDGVPVFSVAHLQEFGGKNDEGATIPPRPFMRPAMDNELEKWKNHIFNEVKKEFEKGKKGNLLRAFKSLGAMVHSDIVEYIHKVTSPPLAPATIANRARRRGISMEEVNDMDAPSYNNLVKPLEDTGQMIGSVTHKAWSD